MKKAVFLTFLLIFLSFPGFAQSYIAVGPQLGATTSSGFPGGSQTQAGGFVQGQYSFRVASLEFGMGGSMSVTNQPRFFDDGDGAVFEAEPIARMYVPVSNSLSFYFDGGANMQRVSDVTVINPVAGLGIRHMAKTAGGELDRTIQVGFKCLFDDVNNDGNPATKVWRGFRFEGQVYKKLTPTLGFLVGGKVDRQSNAVLFLQPRTQATVNVGLAFGPR